MRCCSKNNKEVSVLVDVNKKETDSSSVSIVSIISLSGQDTVANNEITIIGIDLNLDSIIEAEKTNAMNIVSSSSKIVKDCKKPCCKGCKATDTLGLAVVCLADHSCCNPNFN